VAFSTGLPGRYILPSQGFRTTPFSVHDKTEDFGKRLGFVIKEVESGQVPLFPFWGSFISENEIS
jgi:hypothetical protein